MTVTVFGCSLLIVSEEGFSEENVENVEFCVDVVVGIAVVAVEGDVGSPHWTCTIPPVPPTIQKIRF